MVTAEGTGWLNPSESLSEVVAISSAPIAISKNIHAPTGILPQGTDHMPIPLSIRVDDSLGRVLGGCQGIRGGCLAA